MPIWLTKNFSFNKKGTLLKRGSIALSNLITVRPCCICRIGFKVSQYYRLFLIIVYIFLSRRVVLFVFVPLALCTTVYKLFIVICPLLFQNEFLYSIMGMLPCYFFSLSFLLDGSPTSPPTGSDDFVVLLYFHIVH